MLLAGIASFLSFTTLSAASNPNLSRDLPTAKAVSSSNLPGQGFYICGQLGGGMLFLSGEGSVYEIDSQTGVLRKTSGNGSVSQALPSLQLNWGYSHRFDNDLTLGFEATVVSPAVRFGYMMNNQHHIALGVHYALVARVLLDYMVDYAKKDIPAERKKFFKLDLEGISGLGGSLSYEYFASSKNFFRAQLRADYYGVVGEVGGVAKVKKGLLPFAIDGKGTAWDITLGVGFGSQW